MAATGRAGQWVIPDYAAAAADWDAVHVSVAGYLTTAGIAIPAGAGAHTTPAVLGPGCHLVAQRCPVPLQPGLAGNLAGR